MTLIQFFRILNKNLNLFLLCSIVLVVIIFFFTRNLPDEYQAETEVYTGIASGLNVASINNPALDYFATSNEFDNLLNIIKSRQTLEEVGERLLVMHMMLDTADPRYISGESWENFRYIIPKDLEDSLLVPGSVEATLDNIQNYREDNYGSYKVKLLFEEEASPYSYKAIEKIDVFRLQNSDLIRITYTWSDPGIVKSTLDILNEVFTDKLSQIKSGQSNDVIEYYRDQVEQANLRLQNAEKELKAFRVDNRIINYDEQTRSIAALKEQMEDEYQKEMAVRAAARASVKKLEKQLDLNKEFTELGNLVVEKRNQLAEMKGEIAELEVYFKDSDQLVELRERARKLENELTNIVNKRYAFSKTPEGLPLKNVLQEWLTYTLALDEAEARLEVFETRKEYFNRVYDEFSPLGSEIAKLERTIAVEERNYLELLNSLNMAIMRQQSETLASGGLVVTVEPKFPLKPKKSKSTLLLLVGAVVGFVVPFGIVIILEFLDNSIRTIERAEDYTGLKLLGAFPDLTPRTEVKNVDMDWLTEKSMGLMSQNTRLEMRHLGIYSKKPKYVLMFSTRKEEGKTMITDLLCNELVSMNFKVLVISHKEMKGKALYDRVTFENSRQFLKTRSYEELVPAGYDPSLYDFVFISLDGLLAEQYPPDIAEKADMAFCIVSVQRSWNRADKLALREFTTTLKVQPRLIVNGLEPDYMDVVLGDIKKSRSALRKFFKTLFTLQFSSRSFNR